MNRKLLSFFLLLTCGIILSSCLGDDDTFDASEQFEKEQIAIDEYLTKNDLDAEVDELYDLRYIIDTQGVGESPKDTSVVTVSYSGRLLSNGLVFDEGDSASFMLGGLIGGWRILLPKLKEGGKMTMFIPSFYGYGNISQDSIPANSTLIFDVELHKVETLFEYEQRKIDEYLQENNLTAEIDSVYGLRYIITQEGTGDYPASSSEVNVDYVGKLMADDKKFDSGEDKDLDLSRLIKGWSILMPYVREGGKITMFIPSKYAYGRSGLGKVIPGNATLIFEVTLNEIIEE